MLSKYKYSFIVLQRCKLYSHPTVTQNYLRIHVGACLPSKVVHRVPCPPPPPPPCKPRPVRKGLWATAALLGVTGAFMHYAHDKPEVRDWITIHASWFDDLIAMAYQENQGYKESALDILDGSKNYMYRLLGLNPGPKECRNVSNTCVNPRKHKEKKEDEDGTDEDLTACDSASPSPPALSQDIGHLRQCIKDNGDHAANSYRTAADACRVYIAEASGAIESMNVTRLKGMQGLIDERKALEEEFVGEAERSVKRIKELSRYDCAADPPAATLEARALAAAAGARVDKERDDYLRLRHAAEARDAQIVTVVKAVTDLQTEVQCLCPTLKLEDKRPKMECDADVFMINMYRKRDILEADLEYTLSRQSPRVDHAVEHLRPTDEKLAKKFNADLAAATKKKRDDMIKRLVAMQTDQTNRLARQEEQELKEQLAAMDKCLVKKLMDKEKQMTAKTQQMIRDQIAAERGKMREELAVFTHKLAQLEAGGRASAEAEKAARNAQALYGAANELLAKTGRSDPLIPIVREVKDLEKIGEKDPLVQSVLKAIPPTAKENGIVPEVVLRKKFYDMENAALSVALVESEGAPLFVYLISLVQSTFLFMKPTFIPYDEKTNPPEKVPDDLDTFDLMQRARYWMGRGDLVVAHRYVSALQGASLGAARAWLDAVRDHLETKKAAQAILALAKAKSVQHI